MTGIFFIARLGSKRLEKKHLYNVNGKTLIEWLVLRFLHEFNNEISRGKIKLFITTTESPENKIFQKIFKEKKVDIYFGDNSNIPKRLLSCANQHKISKIIAIDGDDILCSTSSARKVFKALDNYDYVKTKGLPLGMNITGFTKEFLSKTKASNFKILETGWTKIFNDKNIYLINQAFSSKEKKIRMTLDYIEDFQFFQAVFLFLGSRIVSISDNELIEVIEKESFSDINSFLSELYWKNFKKEQNLENE